MKGSNNLPPEFWNITRHTADEKTPGARRAILFVNPEKKQAELLSDKIADELRSLGIETDTFSLGEKPDFAYGAGYDVAITLGGDGTVLFAARAVSPKSVPIFPVNLGTFGFIAGVQPREWREVFGRWMRGEVSVSRRLMLEIRVMRGDDEIFRDCCLNDAVISALAVARIIKLKVFCDESHLSGKMSGSGRAQFLELGEYRSDGLIVATPTGSTAYSAAAGGPIVDPELEALILNPICPFTLTHRPMILSAAETIMIEVDEGQREKILLTIDGQVTEKLKSGDRIYLKKAPNFCYLIASGRGSFYNALKTKLAWVGGAIEGSHD